MDFGFSILSPGLLSTLVTRSQLCLDSSSVVAATVASPCSVGRHQLLSTELPLPCHLRRYTGSSSPFKQSQPESIESSRPHLHASLYWFSRMFSSSFGPSQMDRAFVFHIERSKPRNKHG
ncbi:hypothetical protein DY000_02063344 [Brassica cretica]|uniref:Secreted protein n=1 Tax=Brassica cretica TaxID=69181 RepID=A0ABQ7AU24_BRACR|nr:hypothetical protein DY000_02063344 [Brassica cretica]